MAATHCRKLALWFLEKQKRRQLTATLLLLVNQLFRLFYTRFTARLFGVAITTTHIHVSASGRCTRGFNRAFIIAIVVFNNTYTAMPEARPH